MEAKDLMHNDWVFCEGQPTPSNVRIKDINDDGVWFEGDKYEGSAHYDRIFPISLTPEILEKNGFSRNGLDIALFDRKGGDDFVGAANLQYVHELQHALTLCGIKKEIKL